MKIVTPTEIESVAWEGDLAEMRRDRSRKKRAS